VIEERGAGRRQLHLPPRSVEQQDPELLLEQLDLPAEGRLRDLHPLRRPPEVTLLGDRNEIAQVAELHDTCRVSQGCD
jgi:hypothetical protein